MESENARINALVNRAVGIDVLHRILTIHCVNVNIKKGIACKRIPSSVSNVNLLVLLRSALLSQGVFATSEEEEWILNVVFGKPIDKSTTVASLKSTARRSMREFEELFRDMFFAQMCTSITQAKSISTDKSLVKACALFM